MAHFKYSAYITRLVDDGVILEHACDYRMGDGAPSGKWLGRKKCGVVRKSEQGKDGSIGCNRCEKERKEVACGLGGVKVGANGNFFWSRYEIGLRSVI
jgi:hypothetical protein